MRASISPWISSLWLGLIALTQAQTITVTATPTSPTPPSYTSLDDFKDTVLSVSNSYRREHNAGHLVWNETLTDYALDWARECKWEHSVCHFPPIPQRKKHVNRVMIARPLRRKPRLRLPQRHSRHLRLGRRTRRLQLPQTHRLHRANGPFHAVGLESDGAGGLRGGGLRIRGGRGRRQG